MQPFFYEALPMRVAYGSGTLGLLPNETQHLGIDNALVLSTPQQEDMARRACELLGERCGGFFSGARMHTPTDVTQTALERLRAAGCNGIVAIGGGSTIGLAKALALRTDLPQIAIPTTYAGSEVTPILGQTENGVKTTLRSPAVLPESVIYDVELTVGLPVGISITSGINAIAHAVEALYAKDRNPVISLMAEEGVRALARSLPVIHERPHDRESRSDALYGAWLCGACLGSVGMALHHKLCHVLGGLFDLPHSDTHSVILPHAVAYNSQAAPEAMARIAAALGVEHAASGLYELNVRLEAPTSLAEIGMPESGIEAAVDQAAGSDPYWNPAPIERDRIRDLLIRAWSGQPPATAG